ncbi:outer membrane protein transport protein [Paraglaciecola marina]|uniref:outer membrane protein transport protein n=1 Tax=Paraglaciecola marina TaxID=2500157 RepID=UPI00105FFB52|nr:outer membrane protein transport protein [Paraglaciecola marina]
MKFNRILLTAGLSVFSLNAFSAAFQLAEHSASGLGRAFAGDAAIAENASVVARNPALMSQFTENQLSIVGTFVLPDVSLEGESTPAYSSAEAIDDDSIAPNAFVPAAYYVMPIDDKVAVGFGVFSNFGLATDFPEDYDAGQIAGKTEIVTVNLNASASYRVTDALTIAAGLNFIYAEAQVTRHAGVGFPVYLQANFGSTLGVTSDTEAVYLEGDDTGYGWNIGLAYDLDENSRFGFHYRSSTDIAFDGEYSNELPAVLGGLEGVVLPGSLNLELPAMAEFSGSHQLNEKYGLHYSINWTQWSSFEQLEAYVEGSDTPVFSKTENFSNSFRYSIGGDYQLNEQTKLRAGIAYDKTPTDPDHLSISIPDTDRVWLSAGATYTFSDSSTIDLGVTVIKGKERTFVEPDNLGGEWEYTSQGDAALVAAQYNYVF